MRGTDKRPYPVFVKAYMHNGVFKSLKDVVHFYNKRNIAVDAGGKEFAFDLRKGPPVGYTALFPPPEVLENVQNVAGVTPAQATTATESNGQVGNSPRKSCSFASGRPLEAEQFNTPGLRRITSKNVPGSVEPLCYNARKYCSFSS